MQTPYFVQIDKMYTNPVVVSLLENTVIKQRGKFVLKKYSGADRTLNSLPSKTEDPIH